MANDKLNKEDIKIKNSISNENKILKIEWIILKSIKWF